ncbi:hypothetical protein [Devosia elaeis]|nr:hypothetical protein [Devosia elaeis]
MARPDDIPQDVLDRAYGTVEERTFEMFPDDRLEMVEHVARAILAERERCVKVAEALNGWGADCGRGGHAEHIAKAIRGEA